MLHMPCPPYDIPNGMPDVLLWRKGEGRHAQHWISLWEEVLPNRVNFVLAGFPYSDWTSCGSSHNISVCIGGPLRNHTDARHGKRFTPLPKRLGHFWVPLNFYLVGTGGSFCRGGGDGSVRGMEPFIHLHLVQSWMRGAIRPFLHTSLLRRQGDLDSIKLGNGEVVNLRVRG